MLFSPVLVALILGIVEGATEFLPVSSTGHLIAAGAMLRYTGAEAETFSIVIQVGAILAVIWHYRLTLAGLLRDLGHSTSARGLVLNLLMAFLPAVVVGLVAHDWIKARLFSVTVVAWALIVGGLLMFLLEWRRPRITVESIDRVSIRQALGVGLAQLLAMIPGTSRAAATILGGYAFGLSRPAATEFSFLLAIPTIVGAAGLDVVKGREALMHADLTMFAIGTAVSFVVALLAIRVFLRFVQSNSFRIFAWYRIAFGALLLVLVGQGLL